MQWGVNNLPKVVAQQRRGWASNPRLLDRKSDALPLSHRATPIESSSVTLKLPHSKISVFNINRPPLSYVYSKPVLPAGLREV